MYTRIHEINNFLEHCRTNKPVNTYLHIKRNGTIEKIRAIVIERGKCHNIIKLSLYYCMKSDIGRYHENIGTKHFVISNE